MSGQCSSTIAYDSQDPRRCNLDVGHKGSHHFGIISWTPVDASYICNAEEGGSA